ncbi:MAG TPA: glycoside hydrolase family 15 protein [Bryobacteraceae bacterium]|nr:glycoside hydrolase family 15 protein [Bryobacteraceae bacterium]
MAGAYRPISDYGVIGDMHTAVLISADGCIDWGCLPHFDSPAMFLRLLDARKGGYCAIAMQSPVGSSRRYLDGTNILETTYFAKTGRVVVTDFMPVRKRKETHPMGQDMFAAHRIIRLIRCVEGTVECSVDIKPTFSFALEEPKVTRHATGAVVFQGATDALHVQCPQLKIARDGSGSAKIRLYAGDETFVVLAYDEAGSKMERMDLGDVRKAFRETRHYWTEWSKAFRYEGEWRDEVLRSALLLKLLTFEPTGAILAAPTTSLPEAIGGARNWDYRLSWLRDSQFVVLALMDLGYFGEARDFYYFLKSAAAGPVEDLQILYGIRGERRQKEAILKHLDGYRGSQPVRVGNLAGGQRQLDVYGELLDCMHSYWTRDTSSEDHKFFSENVWPMVAPLAGYVVEHWREPDSGIWESRGPVRHFVHSKAMCWVALERAIRLAVAVGHRRAPAPWRRERDAIFRSLVNEGFNRDIGAFVQYYGSRAVDASVLRLPMLGVIDAKDPRMVSTIKQIERSLVHNGLVYRYPRANDNIPGNEAAFTSCTLWLVNNYAMLGRVDEAKELFRHVLSFQSPLGLFAEEIDPVTREQLGNYPQAMTHVALIGSALRLG